MYHQLTDDFIKQKTSYRCAISGDGNFQWYYCEHIAAHLPNQGWKIHISANFSNAIVILKITVPYFIENDLSFKHTCSEKDLLYLNSGSGGLTQVGKFITVYFNNEDDFVFHIKRICNLFNEDYSTPFIITDKQYDIRFPVFYRYGGIAAQKETQNESGIIENLIADASGNLQEDKRENMFILPEGIIDPFENTGIVNKDYSNKYLANRYVTISRIAESYKTEIYLGIDLQHDYCCIKMAKPQIEIEKNCYSDNLLENESRILSLLDDDHFPKLVGAFMENNRKVIVTSYFDGFNLHDFIRINAAQGIFPSKAQTKRIFLSILDNVKKLEEKGIIHNDLKPNNIIINRQLDIFFIDFETSYTKADNNAAKSSIKTRGFFADSAIINPDYYALGMILYFIQTGYNISEAPRDNHILERPLHYMTGKLIPEMETYIMNLCGNYYHSVDAIMADFVRIIDVKASRFTIKHKDMKAIANSYRNITRNVAAWLFANCIEKDHFTYWNSSYHYNKGEGRMDINVGASGILIFLSAYLSKAKPFSDEHFQKFLNAIKYVSTNKLENQITGLFVGESGKVLAALIALFSINKFDINLINNNIAYIRQNLPHNDDFFNGKAGTGFLFIILYVITHEKSYIEAATDIAHQIIENREIVDNNIVWKDLQTQNYFLGFAHGLSGIGYFLVLLQKFAPDQKLLEIILHISETLINNTTGSSKKSKLINWPTELGGSNSNNHWCHGTPGTAYFFLELYKLTKEEKYLSILKNCANTVISASTCMNPTMCHGLAGNINFLINYYQLTKNKKIKSELFRLSEVLKMSGILVDNYYLFPSENATVVTPDFWVGFSGTAYVLQRLTDIENNLDFLSVEYYDAISGDLSHLQLFARADL